jgi:hypothetical protein
MPPKRSSRAAAGTKRSSLPATPAESPATRRQKTTKTTAAAAAPAEETTTIEVPGSRQDWLAPLHEMYGKHELADVVLIVGDRSLFAHKVVLAMVSPMWKAQFCSPMAESQSKEVELEGVDWLALKAIVDFAYTGKVALSGATVVSIIQAANRFQVEAVERTAVDFLVGRLDAGNVLDAMALGTHLQVGTFGRELRDQSRAWHDKNFPLVAKEPSFMQLPPPEVACLLVRGRTRSRRRRRTCSAWLWTG